MAKLKKPVKIILIVFGILVVLLIAAALILPKLPAGTVTPYTIPQMLEFYNNSLN
ncbi:MAG: hypothetical protein IJF18_04655 [Oscillospiraceae bacterium]|nr:hypothetical protein [Oscillospiraceae bacterium]